MEREVEHFVQNFNFMDTKCQNHTRLTPADPLMSPWIHFESAVDHSRFKMSAWGHLETAPDRSGFNVQFHVQSAISEGRSEFPTLWGTRSSEFPDGIRKPSGGLAVQNSWKYVNPVGYS